MPVIPHALVEIQEEHPEAVTSGTYGAESITFDAAANAVTNHDIVLPIGISLMTARIDTKLAHDGDKIGFDIGPETAVGVLDAAIAASATVIDVPQSVVDLFTAGILWLGQHLILDDGTNKDDCGIVKAFDAVAKTLTTTVGTINAFAIGAGIKITTSMSPAILSDGWIELEGGDNKVYYFGETKIGGSFIPAGKTIRIRYTNIGAQVKVPVILEYLY
jgi:hypothetical protein